jgi:sulfite reductase (NADPH) hemoprotein beta-component
VYKYDPIDQRVDERVAVSRPDAALAGGDRRQFRPLRLQNGCTSRSTPDVSGRHSVRTSVDQAIAQLAQYHRKYEAKPYHARTSSSTGQGWRTFRHSAELAKKRMHAIQTSGNCVRNITSDHFGESPGTKSSIPALRGLFRQW